MERWQKIREKSGDARKKISTNQLFASGESYESTLHDFMFSIFKRVIPGHELSFCFNERMVMVRGQRPGLQERRSLLRVPIWPGGRISRRRQSDALQKEWKIMGRTGEGHKKIYVFVPDDLYETLEREAIGSGQKIWDRLLFHARRSAFIPTVAADPIPPNEPQVPLARVEHDALVEALRESSAYARKLEKELWETQQRAVGPATAI